MKTYCFPLSVVTLSALAFFVVFFLIPGDMDSLEKTDSPLATRKNAPVHLTLISPSPTTVTESIPMEMQIQDATDWEPVYEPVKAPPAPATSIASATAIQTGQQIAQRLKALQERQSQKLYSSIQGLPRGVGHKVLNPKQQKAIDELLVKTGPSTTLHMDNISGTLRYLEGDLSRLVEGSALYQGYKEKRDYSNMALALADEMPLVLNIQNPQEEFFAEKVKQDDLGMTHVVLQQKYQGTPIWGAEISVHFNAEQEPVQISGLYSTTPENLSDQHEEIDSETAVLKAKVALEINEDGMNKPEAKKMIFWDIDRLPFLCYRVSLSPNYGQSWDIFVSAADGSIVHKYDRVIHDVATGQAPDLNGDIQTFQCWEDQGLYFPIDTSKPMFDPGSVSSGLLKGIISVFDYKNQNPYTAQRAYSISTDSLSNWDPTVVSVMHNLSLVYDYYQDTFNLNSMDDAGMDVIGIIHYRYRLGNGESYNDNASWDSTNKIMLFGDGDLVGKGKLPQSLDVAAHELTHGVDSFASGLIYENQPGALLEHLADFFACMVDRDDWLLGDGLDLFNNTKIAMRDMANPGNPNVYPPQPAHMSEYLNWSLDEDHGGVHLNSGIPNRMSYLLCDGPQGIGKSKAEQIIHRTRYVYLLQRSQFIDYRRGAIAAAKDLYGQNSPEVQAVVAAFEAVGILDGEETPPSTPGKQTTGEDALVFLEKDPSGPVDTFRSDYSYKLVLNRNGQNSLLAPRYVANARPAMSGDGQWGIYIDINNNMYWTDGQNEDVLSDQGVVRTVAMSKDMKYVAFTTIDYNDKIYLIDIAQSKVIEVSLQIPSTGEGYNSLQYADVLTFNYNGNHLIFDGVQEQGNRMKFRRL